MDTKNPYEKNDDVDFKEVTNYTQLLRFKLVDKLLSDGIPDEKEQMDFLLKVLNFCDKTSLDVEKLEKENALNEVQSKSYVLVNDILSDIKKNPFLKQTDDDIPEFETVEGEDKIGIDILDNIFLNDRD